MIVLIGGEKGGTGKSTIATNLATWLAHAGRDVLLLDADPQSTSANWAAERSEHPELPPVHCVQKYGSLIKPVKDLRTRYEDIVIDAGGRDSEELRSGMVVADIVFSPAKASQSDLWTIEHLAKLVGMARSFNSELAAAVLVSMAPTNPRIREADEASELLGQFEELELADTMIRERKAYRDAMREGRGVIELRDPKAIHEIYELAEEIYGDQIQIETAYTVAGAA